MTDMHAGFEAMSKYPLFEALHKRRSRRISLGIQSVPAGSNTYTSNAKPQPLSELEEAVLIAAIGLTGVTLPDRPFADPTGAKILGTPNLNFPGRAAGSTDNCQATHFFLFNDTGAYLLRRLEGVDPTEPITPEVLIRRATQSKVKILDKRPDFPREFPYYLDSNRFLSNVPGSTILFPVVDMTRQYINALMYLLTEPAGHRPALLDDRNFYLPAGVAKWIQWLSEQGHQAAARHPWHHADADRGGAASAEPHSDAASDGPRRLDPFCRWHDGAIARAGIRLCHASLSRARFFPLGNLSHRGAKTADRTAALHRMHVPALLPEHGGRRPGDHRFQIPGWRNLW